MDRECENNSCDFLVGLGDNFYWDGVKNDEDPRFKFTFENVYGKSSERENIKTLDFWHILRNHDYRWDILISVRED